ncbi:MAG TPA: hypothetical protein VG371_14430 [Solirubrobacteraceae bacterium]|nr:hypothetical protein [Solirubrobacteraceae bacterium]
MAETVDLGFACVTRLAGPASLGADRMHELLLMHSDGSLRVACQRLSPAQAAELALELIYAARPSRG